MPESRFPLDRWAAFSRGEPVPLSRKKNGWPVTATRRHTGESALAIRWSHSHLPRMSSIDARAFPYEFVRPRSRRDRLEQLARLDAFANLFDTAFVIPGTNVRFGIDALIGLAPGIGDVITTGMSLWLLYEARKLGAPWHVIGRMLGNVAVDGVVGAVPLVGDAFDVLWRGNRRNMRLLRGWLERETRGG
ncbi:MAG: DUF4112 domain-containing protein [Rhodoplanes sp.]